MYNTVDSTDDSEGIGQTMSQAEDNYNQYANYTLVVLFPCTLKEAK